MLIVSIVITNDCSQNGGNKLAADLRIELAKLGLGEPSKQKMSHILEKVHNCLDPPLFWTFFHNL